MSVRSAAVGLWGSARALIPPIYFDALFWWLSGGFAMAWGVAFWLAAARFVDSDELGLAAAAVGTVALLNAVSNLGLGLAFVRFLPAAGIDGRRLLNSVLHFGAISATVAAGVLLLGAWAAGVPLDVLEGNGFRVAFYIGFVVVDTTLMLQQYAFMALRRMELAVLQNAGMNLGRIGALIGLVWAQNAFGILFVWGVAETVAVALGLFWLLPMAYPGYRFRVTRSLRLPLAGMFRFALGNHLAHLLTLAPAALLPWMVVERTDSSSSAAYFYVAWGIAGMVLNVSLSLALSLLAEGSRNEDREALSGQTRRVLMVCMVVSAAIVAALVISAPLVLGVFGSEYADNATALLRGLLVGALIGAPVQVVIAQLRVRRETGKVIGLAALTNLPVFAIAFLLLPSQGTDGVIVAWLIGQGLGLAAALTQLTGRVGLRLRAPAVPEVDG